MKKRILYMMALLLAVAAGTWAQDLEPAPVYLTPSADGKTWTLPEGMPEYDVELQVEYYTTLALNEVEDNASTLTYWDGCEVDVTLKRTLTTGGWNTFALPFNVSSADVTALKNMFAEQSASIGFKELESSSFSNEVLTLNFEDATEIKAGHPYLVKVSQNVDLATLPATIDAVIAEKSLSITNPFKSVIISSAVEPTKTEAVNFVPTLGKTLVTGPEGDESNAKAVLFLAADNKLVNPTWVNYISQQSSYLKGFRAYFQVKGQAAEARSFTLNMGDGTTGIVDNKREPITNNRYYDLQGRKVQNTAQKGVYIQNGKKVVIK